jgi:hypothetical protein
VETSLGGKVGTVLSILFLMLLCVGAGEMIDYIIGPERSRGWGMIIGCAISFFVLGGCLYYFYFRQAASRRRP